MAKILVIEKSGLVFDMWRIRAQVAMGKFEDEFMWAPTPNVGLQILCQNSDTTLVVVGRLERPMDYGSRELLADIRRTFSGTVVKVSDLEEPARRVFLKVGFTHATTTGGLSSVLQQLLAAEPEVVVPVNQGEGGDGSAISALANN